MEKFYFKLGQYQELKEIELNGINLEAILYDATRGVNLSIVEIINYYTDTQLQNKITPEPIQIFVLKKLKNLVTGEIEPNELLNPNGGKPQKRFYPKRGNRNLDQIKSLKFFQVIGGGISMRKAYKQSKIIQPKPLSLTTIQDDKRILAERKKRLLQVSDLLLQYSTLENISKKLIKKLHSTENEDNKLEIESERKLNYSKIEIILNNLHNLYKSKHLLI